MVEVREFKSMPGKAGTTGRKGISPKDRKSARGSGSGPTQKMRRSVTDVERYLRKMNFLYPCCVFHIGNRSWVFFCTFLGNVPYITAKWPEEEMKREEINQTQSPHGGSADAGGSSAVQCDGLCGRN